MLISSFANIALKIILMKFCISRLHKIKTYCKHIAICSVFNIIYIMFISFEIIQLLWRFGLCDLLFNIGSLGQLFHSPFDKSFSDYVYLVKSLSLTRSTEGNGHSQDFFFKAKQTNATHCLNKDTTKCLPRGNIFPLSKPFSPIRSVKWQRKILDIFFEACFFLLPGDFTISEKEQKPFFSWLLQNCHLHVQKIKNIAQKAV